MPSRLPRSAHDTSTKKRLTRELGCFADADDARCFALERLHDSSSLRTHAPFRRAAMLDAIASTLGGAREQVLMCASRETALTLDELAPEFDRMTGTLRMFAKLVREGSWVRASIDTAPQTAAAQRACIGPPHDVRRMLVPLGSCAGVFGASNFPLAYGVCGGDTASALAAGLGVLVKEHPAHPQTGRLLTQLACRAGAPLAYVYHTDASDFSVSAQVVEVVDAIGFTGSVEGGMAIAALAQQDPQFSKPAYCEMGSINIVIVSGKLLARRSTAEQIATELAASITSRVGQQCTRPGCLQFLQCSAIDRTRFLSLLASKLDDVAPRRMLSEHVARRYKARCNQLQRGGLKLLTSRRNSLVPVGNDLFAVPQLFDAANSHGSQSNSQRSGLVLDNRLTNEVFGPAVIALGIGDSLGVPGALTRTFVVPRSGGRAAEFDGIGFEGRTIVGGVPTGVRVCASMVHGGPYPASNAPHTTAVGPLAIERWCRPVCWQNTPQSALPWELQNRNPHKLMRIINGKWTRASV